jgi:hypothetical protein
MVMVSQADWCLARMTQGSFRHVFEADDLGPDAEQVLDAPLHAEAPQLAQAIAPDAAQQDGADDHQRRESTDQTMA